MIILLLFYFLLIYFFFIFLRYIHFEILILSRKLNQAYAYQILLDLIVQFSLLLYILYNIYFYLISLNLSEMLYDKKIIRSLIWVLLHSTKIILLNIHCTNFYYEVRLIFYIIKELIYTCRYTCNARIL